MVPVTMAESLAGFIGRIKVNVTPGNPTSDKAGIVLFKLCPRIGKGSAYFVVFFVSIVIQSHDSIPSKEKIVTALHLNFSRYIISGR